LSFVSALHILFEAGVGLGGGIVDGFDLHLFGLP
jgi:hypothetical protein